MLYTTRKQALARVKRLRRLNRRVRERLKNANAELRAVQDKNKHQKQIEQSFYGYVVRLNKYPRLVWLLDDRRYLKKARKWFAIYRALRHMGVEPRIIEAIHGLWKQYASEAGIVELDAKVAQKRKMKKRLERLANKA